MEIICNRTARTVLKVRPLEIHVKDLYRVLEWHTCKSLRNYHEILLFRSLKQWKKSLNLSRMLESHQVTSGDEVNHSAEH